LKSRESEGRHTPRPGRQPARLHTSQRWWDRDAGGAQIGTALPPRRRPAVVRLRTVVAHRLGRLRSGDVAPGLHDLRRRDPSAEMCIRGWARAPGFSDVAPPGPKSWSDKPGSQMQPRRPLRFIRRASYVRRIFGSVAGEYGDASPLRSQLPRSAADAPTPSGPLLGVTERSRCGYYRDGKSRH
jgi:hypothetical protein